MRLILQLTVHVKDNEKLLKNLLIVLWRFDYCQLPSTPILLTGSIARYNFSKNHIDISREIVPWTWFLASYEALQIF